MGVQTGRSVKDFTKLFMGAAGGTMYDMYINSLGDVGLDYEEIDMSSWSDLVKGVLVGKPDFELEFGGPVNNTATSGPSTLLRSWVGVMTCLSFDVQVGVRHAYESGEQQFGVTGVVSTNSGVMVTSYMESEGMYTARIRMIAGSAAAPAYGTAAEAVPS